MAHWSLRSKSLDTYTQMRKLLSTLAAIALVVALTSSCKKDDDTSPGQYHGYTAVNPDSVTFDSFRNGGPSCVGCIGQTTAGYTGDLMQWVLQPTDDSVHFEVRQDDVNLVAVFDGQVIGFHLISVRVP